MITVPNNMVACEPFGSLTPEVVGVASGFARAKHKTTLVTTKVVFSPVYDAQKPWFNLSPGDTVYLRGQIGTLDWSHNVYSVKVGEVDMSFILVPLTEIQLMDNNLECPASQYVVGAQKFEFKLT